MFDSFIQHPFVQGIGSGDLDRDKFIYYMLQDYKYLSDYARVFAVGAAKAKDMETMKLLASSVYHILYNEMDIHRAYMRRLGISEDDAEFTEPALNNKSYTAYMLKVAYEGSDVDVVAAILSCASSYAYIARALLRQYPKATEHPFYGEWVRGYTSEDYRIETRRQENLLDRLAADFNEEQYEHLEEIYLTCTRFEGEFWNMAWEKRR
jgi:thiaminase/transcriptional activator TenA